MADMPRGPVPISQGKVTMLDVINAKMAEAKSGTKSNGNGNGHRSGGKRYGPGERHPYLNGQAYKMRRKGTDRDSIFVTLSKLNAEFCDPPHVSTELWRIIDDVMKTVQPQQQQSEQPTDDRVPAYAEDSLALRFAELHGESLRYTAQWKRWEIYNGRRWVPDLKLDVFTLVRRLCREAAARESGNLILAKTIASGKTVAAVEKLARYIEPHKALAAQWDEDLWLLNTPGGAINLKLGDPDAFQVRANQPEHYCTKITAAAPGGECPLFHKFLSETTGGDQEFENYLQMICGYFLTGCTYEQVLFDIFGPPGTGKTTLVELIAQVMGSYAINAPIEVFTEAKNDRHTTELARLEGARLVTTTETNDGRFLAESRVNSVTGGEPITARRMHQDDTTFIPSFKLVIVGNYKPRLKNPHGGIQRRVRLLPLTSIVAQRDATLPSRLKAEYGGILQWMIEGCRKWQEAGGLPSPRVVVQATSEYLANEDGLGRWLDDRIEINRLPMMVGSSELYSDYRDWAETGKEHCYSQKRFSQELESRGFTPTRNKAGKGFIGLKLRVGGDS